MTKDSAPSSQDGGDSQPKGGGKKGGGAGGGSRNQSRSSQSSGRGGSRGGGRGGGNGNKGGGRASGSRGGGRSGGGSGGRGRGGGNRGGGRGRGGDRKNKPKSDLFADLRELETHQIDEMLKEHKSDLRALESQLDSNTQERRAQITTVQALRAALNMSHGMSKERTELFKEMRERAKKINSIKQERDSINKRVSPPLFIIEERLKRTYKELTTLPDVATSAPHLPTEIQRFSFFFELIEMHKMKKQSDLLHSKLVEMYRMQKEVVKKLDELKDSREDIAEKTASETTRLSGVDINYREVNQLNDSIDKLTKLVGRQMQTKRKHKREIGRLDAYLNIRKGDEKRGRKVRVRISTLRDHAATGGTLSIDDLSRILESGGLSALNPPSGSSDSEAQKKKKKKKGRRPSNVKVNVRRGTARAYKKREE